MIICINGVEFGSFKSFLCLKNLIYKNIDMIMCILFFEENLNSDMIDGYIC